MDAVRTVNGVPQPLPSQCGFACDYVAAKDKVAFNWKRKVNSDEWFTGLPPAGAKSWAVVPKRGYAIVDMDLFKGEPQSNPDGSPKFETLSGFAQLQRILGKYGSPDFPRTYVVRTPSGGLHAYFRLPDSLYGKLPDAVHQRGLNVDIRAEGKGYVIGAGSQLSDGRQYVVVDARPVAVMPMKLAKLWIPDPQEVARQRAEAARRNAQIERNARRGYGFKPDLSPIPEGMRHNTLLRYATGWAINHRGTEQQVAEWTWAKGKASGLPEAEIESILRSSINYARTHAPRQTGGMRR